MMPRRSSRERSPHVLLVSEQGLRGGAETSTLLLAADLPERGVKATLTYGRSGVLVKDAKARGIPVLPGTGEWTTNRWRLRANLPPHIFLTK